MGHTHIRSDQKRYAYSLVKQGLKYSAVSANVRTWFGRKYPPISKGTLSSIKTIGDLTGDPAYVPKCVKLGQTLTYAHKKLILDELLALCTTSTRELEVKLQAAEQTQRTDFAHTTINVAIRAAMFTRKKVTLHNDRRDPIQSARVRTALRAYPIECVLNLDASHIRSDEAQRRFARAPVGSRAHSGVFTCANGTLVSVLVGFTIDGFEMDICEIVEGSIDGDRYYQWIVNKVYPRTNRFDRRRLPNSVILLVREPAGDCSSPSIFLSIYLSPPVVLSL
jgi:hypothetical protein